MPGTVEQKESSVYQGKHNISLKSAIEGSEDYVQFLISGAQTVYGVDKLA